MGPGAGVHGGEIVDEGTLEQVLANTKSLTAAYLTGAKRIEWRNHRRKGNGFDLVLKGARENNLQNVTAKIPLGTCTCVTGLSGSGKSSLIIDTLYASAARVLNGARMVAGPHDSLKGLEHCDKVIDIDQSPIGRSREHTSELQSLMRNSYAVFCLKKKKNCNHYKTQRKAYRNS